MAQTQMALDSLDFDATVALAAKVAPHVDILEIGTPCIKHNGIELLKTLRAKFPNNKILVDLKTMDAGFYEAEPFYAAGADICTVLGTADIGTIKGFIEVANKKMYILKIKNKIRIKGIGLVFNFQFEQNLKNYYVFKKKIFVD